MTGSAKVNLYEPGHIKNNISPSHFAFCLCWIGDQQRLRQACAIWPKRYLLAHSKHGHKPNGMPLAPLDSSAGIFKDEL